MIWLNEISPWTVAAFGLGWLGMSGAVALVLGRVLARTNQAAENEELALARAEANRAQGLESDPWLAPEDDEEIYEGRAASGTRFKPIVDEEPAAENVRPLRRAR